MCTSIHSVSRWAGRRVVTDCFQWIPALVHTNWPLTSREELSCQAARLHFELRREGVDAHQLQGQKTYLFCEKGAAVSRIPKSKRRHTATFSQTTAYTGTIAPTRATPGLRSGGRNPLHGKAATYTGTIGSDAHNSGPNAPVAAIPLYIRSICTH